MATLALALLGAGRPTSLHLACRAPSRFLTTSAQRHGTTDIACRHASLSSSAAAAAAVRRQRSRRQRRASSRALATSSCAATPPATPSVLFLSPVWPERSSSAAGVRTCDLLAAFQARGWAASYASPSTPNAHTEALSASGVATFSCQPNREEQMAGVLEATAPTAVVFDRFYAEEAFSFRVRQLAPAALRVLDMQDFHALRAARQRAAAAAASLEDVLAARPGATDDDCLRELAAIHRSDLTLVCSPVELQLLTRHYGIPPSKLALAPFFAPHAPHAPPGAAPGWASRKHFLMIGNWRHPPNLDSARWACQEVWPALQAALPAEGRAGAELHLYGAYAAGAAQQLHRPAAGVHMKGWAPSLDLMLSYRCLLAPLRYGAGLKGKVVDAWWHGLPVVTTPCGAEGMRAADAAAGDAAAAGLEVAAAAAAPAPDPAADGYVWQLGGGGSSGADAGAGEQAAGEAWGGLCGATTAAGVAQAAALLYSEQALWEGCQRRGFELLSLLYDRERNLGQVLAAIEGAAAAVDERRAADFTGAMLWHQQNRATEFFSRWIELKETGSAGGGGSGGDGGSGSGSRSEEAG